MAPWQPREGYNITSLAIRLASVTFSAVMRHSLRLRRSLDFDPDAGGGSLGHLKAPGTRGLMAHPRAPSDAGTLSQVPDNNY